MGLHFYYDNDDNEIKGGFEPEHHPKTIWGKIGWFIWDTFLGILHIIKTAILYIGFIIMLLIISYLFF